MVKSAMPREPIISKNSFLLSLSAMFESDFSLDWLEEMTAFKASVILSILEEETANGLLLKIRPAVYRFSSAHREEWSQRLTTEQRYHFHRQIASILIRELADTPSKPLQIAQHLLHIPSGWQECQWLMSAGDIYSKTFCADKAIACYRHVLSELSSQQGENEDLIFIKAAIAHSNNFAGRADLVMHLGFLRQASQRAKRAGQAAYVLLLEMHIAKYQRLNSQFNLAIRRFERAFSQAETMDNPEVSAAATVFQTYFLFWQGRFNDVIAVYEKSVPDVQKIPIGYFPILAAMMVGHCYTMVGQVAQGLGMLDTLRNYCLDNGDRYMLAHGSSSIAMAMLAINRIDDAQRYLKLALKEAEECRNDWVKALATVMMSLVMHIKREKKESVKYLRRFLTLDAGVQGNLLLFPYLLEICWLIEIGELPAVPGLAIGSHIRRLIGVNNIYIRGLACRYRAFLGKIKTGEDKNYLRQLSLSEKFLSNSGHLCELGKTYVELTRYFLTQGNDKKAKTMIKVAANLFASNELALIPDDLRSLVEKENHDSAILSAMIQIADQMVTQQDNQKMLQQIIATVNRITGAERGGLFLIDEDAYPPKLQLRASKNMTEEQIVDPSFCSSLRVIQEVLDTGRSRIFETGSSDHGTFPSKDTIRSAICVPLILRKKVIGVLHHDNRLLGNVFKPSDVKLLSYFSALAVMELDRDKAYRELERLKRSQTSKHLNHPKVSTPRQPNEGLVGVSKAFRQVLAQIDQVAATDTAILITGETGVGKNMLAAAIHRQSDRCDGPLVTVQCSALAESLITSELFGHEKGAFTGAINRRIGRFELADGGTLFLDEIGDLSAEVQARLLRVLQSKEFERVGGGKDILTSNFRLIAATNKNLESEVQAKRFREDLYYRINVFPLHVPPLRERIEDIPLLVHHFVAIATSKQDRHGVGVSKEVMDALVHYDWPGNIRELENVVQRGVLASLGPSFQLPPMTGYQAVATPEKTIHSLEENERLYILKALGRSGGKIHGPAGAAELLSIHPSTLISRMKKLGIQKRRNQKGVESDG